MGPEVSPALIGKPEALEERFPLLLHIKKSYRQMTAVGSTQKDTLKYLSLSECLNLTVLIHVYFCAHLGFHSKPEREAYELPHHHSMGLSYCHFGGVLLDLYFAPLPQFL